MIAAAIIYGIATFTAVGLSLKRGGPISVVGLMIGAVWVLQGLLYAIAPPEVGDLVASAMNVALILAILSLSNERWAVVIVFSLLGQLSLTCYAAIVGTYSDVCINLLYIVQLLALSWSGGKLVLDSLGDWLARARWSRRDTVAGVWSETVSRPECGRRHKPIVRIGRSGIV